MPVNPKSLEETKTSFLFQGSSSKITKNYAEELFDVLFHRKTVSIDLNLINSVEELKGSKREMGKLFAAVTEMNSLSSGVLLIENIDKYSGMFHYLSFFKVDNFRHKTITRLKQVIQKFKFYCILVFRFIGKTLHTPNLQSDFNVHR